LVVAHAEGPVAFDMPQIMYLEEDERMLDAYVRKMGVQGFPYFFYLDTDENLFIDIYSVSMCWHSVSSHPLSHPVFCLPFSCECMCWGSMLTNSHLSNWTVIALHLRDETLGMRRCCRSPSQCVLSPDLSINPSNVSANTYSCCPDARGVRR